MVDNTQKPQTVDEWLQLNPDVDDAFITQLRDASRKPGFSLDNVDNDYQAFLKQKETQALQIANGDLSQASFDEIHSAWDVLKSAEEGKSAQNLVDARRKMQDFAEQKVEEFSKDVQDLKDNPDEQAMFDMAVHMPEVSEWLAISNDVQAKNTDDSKKQRNQNLEKSMNAFYKNLDEEYGLNDLPSAEQIKNNAATLDDIEKSFGPFAKDGQGKLAHPEFEQMDAFFDKLEIDNSAQDVDKVHKDDYKAQIIETSMAMAKTNLSIDKDFANLSKEEQQKRLAQETLNNMESLVLTALVQQKAEDIAEAKNTEEAIKQLNKESEEFVNRYPHLKNIVENGKNHSKLRQAIEFSYLNTVLKLHGYFDSDLTMDFVGKSFKASSRNQGVDDKSLDDPHVFFEKSLQDKDFKPVLSNRVAIANLAVASSGLEALSKRIAQKTGANVLWKNAKALDTKLKEAYPKAYPVMKGMVTTLSISTGLGPVGLVAYSGVKTYQAVKKSIDNYRQNRQEGQSYFKYLAKNPRELVGIAQAAAGATLTTLGVGGALFSAENMGLAGHLMNGDMGIGQSLASAGGNLFDNMKNAVTHPVETAKNVGNAALEALKNPQKLARMGVAVGAGLAKSAISIGEALKAKGDDRKKLFKKARSEFVAGLTGAGIGLGLSSLMGGVSHGDDANAADHTNTADQTNTADSHSPEVKVGTYHDKPIGPEEYQGDVDKAASTDHDAFEKEAMNKAADEAEAQEKATQQQNDQHQPTAKGGADNQPEQNDEINKQNDNRTIADEQSAPVLSHDANMPMYSQLRELSLDLEKAYAETGNIGQALNKVLHEAPEIGMTEEQIKNASQIMQDRLQFYGVDNESSPQDIENAIGRLKLSMDRAATLEERDILQQNLDGQVPQPHSEMPSHSQMRELSLDLEKAYEETGNIGQALNKVLHEAPEIGMTEEQAMKASQIMQDSLRSYGIVEGEYSHQDVEKAIERLQHETAREAALEEREILQQNQHQPNSQYQAKIDELRACSAAQHSELGSEHTSTDRAQQVQNLRGTGNGNELPKIDPTKVTKSFTVDELARAARALKDRGNG